MLRRVSIIGVAQSMFLERHIEVGDDYGTGLSLERGMAFEQESTYDYSDENSDGEVVCGNTIANHERNKYVDSADAVAKESTDKQKAYILCDLCDTIVNIDTSLHIKQEHSEACELYSAETSTVSNPQLEDIFGKFAYDTVQNLNQGKSMFRIMQDACDQLNNINLKDHCVFPFGSCVSLGCWDGMSDGDFALIPNFCLETNEEETSTNHGPKLLLNVLRRLCECGFQFDELEPVFTARVPVIRRKRAVRQPPTIGHNGAAYIIEYFFNDEKVYEVFLARSEPTIMKSYNGIKNPKKDAGKLKEVYQFKNGSDAIRLFSRREGSGITKLWSPQGRLPEIFSIDFDITSNAKGVRNSWFLREYFSQNFLFRIGVFFLKMWSTHCGIKNSRKGYLTSYAVSVLWVYYLLCSGHAMFVDPQKIPKFPTRDKLTAPYMPLLEPDAKANPQKYTNKLGGLLQGFFDFYAHFDWELKVVSLRKDCTKIQKKPTKKDFKCAKSKNVDLIKLKDRLFNCICIEDPYEDMNLGCHLSPLKAGWVMGQFQAAHTLCREQYFRNDALRCKFSYSLLLDPFAERCEEVLRVAMYRHLIGSTESGMDTVGHLRAALKAADKVALAGYEMFHRLSDLWFDVARMAEDDKNRAMYPSKRLAETPRQHPLSIADPKSCDNWIVLCDDRKVPPRGTTADDRVVFLINSNLFHSISCANPFSGKNCTNKQGSICNVKTDKNLGNKQAKLSTYASTIPWLDQVSECVSHAKEAFHQLMKKIDLSASEENKNALCGVFLGGPYDNPLIRLQFFYLDYYGFPTYHARKRMLNHLSAVALALQKDAIKVQIQKIVEKEIIHMSDVQAAGKTTKKDHKSHTVKMIYKEGYRQRMLKAVGALINADAKQELSPITVEHILSSTYYVRQPANLKLNPGTDLINQAWTPTSHLLKFTSQPKQHDNIIRKKTMNAKIYKKTSPSTASCKKVVTSCD